MWTRIALFVVAFTYLPIVSATATPVTWESVGTIGFASDPMNLLPGVSSGSPYTFRFTFDPAATSDGLLSSLCGGTVSHFADPYAAEMAIGGSIYTLGTNGGIFEVYDVLSNQCSPTLVQFLFSNSTPFAFLQASLGFPLASTGILPEFPSGNLTIFAQLSGGRGQLSGVGNLHPVPEPTSLTLLGAGVAVAIIRRRRSRNRL
jgi:PEP-CTERM motif-containing protein